tara:strand:+ start:79071 stop:80510 length:1440 start_codon:yes stop_codon:yes gene_type:complete
MSYEYSQTKIVFTLGPATDSEEMMEQLVRRGVDVCRLNMAHGTHEWVRESISRLRSVCDRLGRQVAIMMDVKGPEIRTGAVDEPFMLTKGERIDLVISEEVLQKRTTDVRAVTVNYPGLVNDIHEGDTVLVDSGLIRFKVLAVTEDTIECEVLIPGELGSRRHINLPGVTVNLPALTEKDKKDILVGVEGGIVYFALSFVRQGKDIQEMREYLRVNGSDAKIIAKIEDQSGIYNLNEIIEESDGLMVARGDLGIECPYQTLPLIQRQMIKMCIRHAKPVIVATHMLESMISAPVPTRAEVSDIATAIFDKTDAVMLSGETTVGKYPLECVDVMRNIALEVESNAAPGYDHSIPLLDLKSKLLRSAVVLAQELDNSAILLFTRHGSSAQIIASLRPSHCPIYAFTDREDTFRRLLLSWGIAPFMLRDLNASPEETMEAAMKSLRRTAWVKPGDNVVAITHLSHEAGIIDSIQVREVPETV